jgi:hypothetical protein
MARNDKLVSPAPTVQFKSDEAAQSVIAHIRSQHEQMSVYGAQQTALAMQKGEEIDRLRRQIDQLDLEKHQHETYARQAREVADGAADTLALLGFPIPPQGGDLSSDVDGSLDRFHAAHNELAAEEGVRL